MHKGELLLIRVEQIDLKRKQIRLYAGATKNDDGRHLPFPSPWLSHDELGQPILSLYKAWTAPVSAREFRPTIPRLPKIRCSQHGTGRHPASVDMKISGHKTEAVYRRYAIVSEQDIADAGVRLEHAMDKRNQRTTTKTTTVRRSPPNVKLLSS